MDRGNFNAAYAYGKIAESQIARWLMRVYGYHLLPAYEIETHSGKGPRLLGPWGELIAPDLLAIQFNRMKVLMQWYEIKHKERFSWFRKGGGRWQTGIDLRHFEDYIKVQEQTGIEVFLLFLHRSSIPSKDDLEQGSEKVCPTGLFGGSLYDLMHNWDHKDSYDKKNRSFPMVYWNDKDLQHIATLDDFMAVLNSTQCKPTGTEKALGKTLNECLDLTAYVKDHIDPPIIWHEGA
jgi:hypothetical protein